MYGFIFAQIYTNTLQSRSKKCYYTWPFLNAVKFAWVYFFGGHQLHYNYDTFIHYHDYGFVTIRLTSYTVLYTLMYFLYIYLHFPEAISVHKRGFSNPTTITIFCLKSSIKTAIYDNRPLELFPKTSPKQILSIVVIGPFRTLGQFKSLQFYKYYSVFFVCNYQGVKS